MVPGILTRSYRGSDDDAALEAMPQPGGLVALLRPGDRGWVAEVGGAVAGFARIDSQAALSRRSVRRRRRAGAGRRAPGR